MAGQYRGEFLRKALKDNPGLQDYIDSLWQNEIAGLLRDIMFYFEIIRSGAFSSTEMLHKMKIDAKLANDLNSLFLFGLIRKRE